MADRPFSRPVPHPAEVPMQMFDASVNWERTCSKWRDLAEQRHAHYLDLYKSGRWRRYYTEKQFCLELAKAIGLAERWAAIAPRPEERGQSASPRLEPAALVELLQDRAA